MVTTFISLLGSLAQANFVWNGDIVLNVAMAGGGVDWLGLLGIASSSLAQNRQKAYLTPFFLSPKGKTLDRAVWILDPRTDLPF